MSENQIMHDLLAKAKHRDINASKEILRRISDKMYFVTRLYIGDHQLARQVEQAGLKKVFARLSEVTNADWFECWVSEVIRNEAVSHLLPLTESTVDGNNYTEADEIPNYMAVLPETAEGKKYRVLEMMDKLCNGARAALAMHLYDGLSVEEIAALLTATPQSVRSWLAEAKETLLNAGFNLGSLITLMDKLNPVSDRAMMQQMHDDIALKSVEEDVLSSVFARSEPARSTDIPSSVQFPDLPSTSGDSANMPAASTAEKPLEDTLSLPVVEEKDSRKHPSDTQLLKKTLFNEDDEETDDEEEEESKGGSIFMIFLIILLLLLLLAGLGWIWMDKFGGGFSLDSIFGSKKDLTSIVVNSDSTPKPTPSPETAPQQAPEVAPEPQSNGEVEIRIDSLNIRAGAGTNYDIVGTVHRGEKYEVLAIEKMTDYTWYQIGEGQWVADQNNAYITYRK